MRNIILVFLLFPAISWAQNELSGILNSGALTIAGQIEQPTQNTMTFISLELMGRQNHLIKINTDGTFVATFSIESAHSNYLSYNNQQITFFADPGDSIYITANSENFAQSAKFSGDNMKSNSVLKAFIQCYLSLNREKNIMSEKINGQEPDQFKKLIADYSTELNLKIDSICRLYSPSYTIREWMRSFAKYNAPKELLQYGRIHQENLPADYYDFTAQYEDASIQDLKCAQYYDSYINKYYDGFRFQEYLAELLQSLEYINQGKVYDGLIHFFQVIDKNVQDQMTKELILTRFCNNQTSENAASVDSAYSAFARLVKSDEYRHYIKNKISERMMGTKEKRSIFDLFSNELIGELTTEIQKSHPNKVLYIDFWGTWCKACYTEFPFSNELHQSFIGQPIEFIYFGCESKKENWQKSISQNDLKGAHYLLTNDQFAAFTDLFNIEGFPRYLIVDKNGVIVNEDANRPSNKDLKAELQVLVNQ